MSARRTVDVVIAGAGIIGLSLGLELRRRGLSVIVLERDRAMRAASWAAGGMLAARDAETPPALLPLALRSLDLYPEYLKFVRELSSEQVPIRTREALQKIVDPGQVEGVLTIQEARRLVPGLSDGEHRFEFLQEESLDPRDLCRALPKAFLAQKGSLLEGSPVLATETSGSGIAVDTPQGSIHAGVFVNCCGAWAGEARLGGLPVEPVKGQAVTVALAPERLLRVLRTPEFYAIPRGDGRVTIGATIEHAGFDQTVDGFRISALIESASELVPEINGAPILESWAGLRPGTPDGLPVLGRGWQEHCWHATGHYRNGILLAPVTARVIAQAIFDETPDIPLNAFSPERFDSVMAALAPPASHLAMGKTAVGQAFWRFHDREC